MKLKLGAVPRISNFVVPFFLAPRPALILLYWKLMTLGFLHLTDILVRAINHLGTSLAGLSTCSPTMGRSGPTWSSSAKER